MTTTDGPRPHFDRGPVKAPGGQADFNPQGGIALRYLTEPLDRACAVLNNLIRLDKRAVQTLMTCRAPLDQETAKQECFVTGGSDECPTMSGLGLLNTVLRATIGQRVALKIDDSALNPFEDGSPEFVPYTGDADVKITTSKAELLERIGVLQSKHNALQDKLTEMEEANKAWQEKSLHQETHADRMKEENEALRKENIDLKKRVLSADSLGTTATLPKAVGDMHAEVLQKALTLSDATLRDMTAQRDALLVESQDHMGKIAELRNRVSGLEQRLHTAETIMGKLDGAAKERSQQLDYANTTVDSLRRDNAELERKRAQEAAVRGRQATELEMLRIQFQQACEERKETEAQVERINVAFYGVVPRPPDLKGTADRCVEIIGQYSEQRTTIEAAEAALLNLRKDRDWMWNLAKKLYEATGYEWNDNEAPTAEQMVAHVQKVSGPPTAMGWAEGLIRQLPDTHEGRNSWLLNHGHGGDVEEMRKAHAERRGVPPAKPRVPDTVSMSLSDFNKLPEYSCTLPTGTKAGKQWKRRKHDGTWCLGTYYELDDLDPASTTQIGISWQHLNITDAAHTVIDMINRVQESDVLHARVQAICKEHTGEETKLPVDVLVSNLFSTIKRDGKRTFPAAAAEARRLEETTTEENIVTYCRACHAKLPNGQPGSERYTCACGASGLRFMSEKPTTVLLPVKKWSCPKCHALLVLRQGVEVVPDTVRCGICAIEWRAKELEEITVSTPHPVGQDEVPKQNQTLPPKQRTE